MQGSSPLLGTSRKLVSLLTFSYFLAGCAFFLRAIVRHIAPQCDTQIRVKSGLAIMALTALTACGGTAERATMAQQPEPVQERPFIHESDVAQQADTLTTFSALELMSGFEEGNPILAPVLELPGYAGYGLLAGVKWGLNYTLREAENPATCANGIRISTTFGYTASASNGTLLLGALLGATKGSVLGPVGLVVGIIAGGISAFYNDNFIDECELQERLPWHDIAAEWENGTLYSNTRNYIRTPHRLAPVPDYFVPARRGPGVDPSMTGSRLMNIGQAGPGDIAGRY